jgi:hypothetical protein
VVVALVEVEFRKVTFWRVEEPLTRRLGMVSGPVRVRLPMFAFVAKRLVDEEVVLNMLVVVALVEVELRAVKF